jgi:hypothetical protein
LVYPYKQIKRITDWQSPKRTSVRPGSDFALEFSFVADNYAPFYSTSIECTDRDGALGRSGSSPKNLLPGVHRNQPGPGGPYGIGGKSGKYSGGGS